MKIMILGCGPAGLFAAHAAATSGHEVAIISKKRKSEMFGAQYLHQPIPGLSSPLAKRYIEYRLQGSIKGYREKVYGDRAVITSPESLEQNHQAWDIREAYSNAWDMYGREVQDMVIMGGLDVQGAITFLQPDLVISSVPAPVLCLKPDEHAFKSEAIWAIGDAPERGVFCPVECERETVLCNGYDAPAWYRVSNIFGYSTVEWPHGKKPPFEGIAEVTKPLSTTCDCLPEVVRVGRYGRWTKGVLSHESYHDTIQAILDRKAS